MTRAVLAPTVVAGLAALAVAHLPRTRAPLFVVNESGSVPRGLYRLSGERAAPGRLVVVTPPRAAEGYLAALGAGPGARLLKRVAAVGGVAVSAQGARLTWPGGAVFRLSRDRSGRRLPSWTGERRLAPNELLLLGDTPTSFDSRYFGPVPESAVEGVYRRVWRW